MFICESSKINIILFSFTKFQILYVTKYFIVTPFRQQVLHLPIVDIQKCQNVYGSTLPVTDHQICAGGELGNDACTGFGGAPLMVRNGDTYYQVHFFIQKIMKCFLHEEKKVVKKQFLNLKIKFLTM